MRTNVHEQAQYALTRIHIVNYDLQKAVGMSKYDNGNRNAASKYHIANCTPTKFNDSTRLSISMGNDDNSVQKWLSNVMQTPEHLYT